MKMTRRIIIIRPLKKRREIKLLSMLKILPPEVLSKRSRNSVFSQSVHNMIHF